MRIETIINIFAHHLFSIDPKTGIRFADVNDEHIHIWIPSSQGFWLPDTFAYSTKQTQWNEIWHTETQCSYMDDDGGFFVWLYSSILWICLSFCVGIDPIKIRVFIHIVIGIMWFSQICKAFSCEICTFCQLTSRNSQNLYILKSLAFISSNKLINMKCFY